MTLLGEGRHLGLRLPRTSRWRRTKGFAVKYDRPVWQIMHECADAMPERFRYDDVKRWFDEHYPEVRDATIRAHLVGLTDGGRAKHVQFAQRRPLFRRVVRGEYEVIPESELPREELEGPGPTSKLKIARAPGRTATTGPDTPSQPPSGRARPVPSAPAFPHVVRALDESPDADEEGDQARGATATASAGAGPGPAVLLVAGIGDRVNVPAPAKEVYRSAQFQSARGRAEAAGAEWYVLSAELGLIAPGEWMSPDSRTLADMDTGYRVTWAGWVAARLESLVGALEGRTIEVDAPTEHIGPLFADLRARGAVVRVVDSAARSAGDGAERAAPDAVLELEPVARISGHLTDPAQLTPADDVSALPELPGLYAWWVDAAGARDLNRSLMLPISSGLVFVGQIGGSPWRSTPDVMPTLREQLQRIQLQGRSRSSAFRMTLATVLHEELGMRTLDDPKLTAWMLQHLSVTVWPMEQPARLRELERQVTLRLNPALNVDHVPPSDVRVRLSQLRRALG